MLVGRDGETLNALPERLDKAIAKLWETDETTDEINRRATDREVVKIERRDARLLPHRRTSRG